MASRASLARRVTRAARALTETGNGTTAPPPQLPEQWEPTLTSAYYAWCRATGVDTRPQYLWPLLHAAHAARGLGIPEIAALEFGVAGGNGLLAMERAAATATQLSGTRIAIYGFDTGEGMPQPSDPRDARWLLPAATFTMDVGALRARLGTAQLVLRPG